MANGQLGSVLRHIHRLAGAAEGEELTDGRLMERFVHGRDEAAFAALVRRHGPLVLGVCWRLVGHEQDAEDAFQATFLVLFRKASSLDRRGSLANWLYTVAYHVALRARANRARRQQRERQVLEMPHAQADSEQVWCDLQPVLDEELNRLPDKYRAPTVLCYLQGKTQEEAARLLGWPVGTLKGRLARARQLLRTRLLRRGVTLSAGLLGTVLAERAVAAVSPGLVDTTVRTTIGLAAGQTAGAGALSARVAALAEGALKLLFLSKLKSLTTLVLTLGLAAVGAGVLVHLMRGQRQARAAVSGAREARPVPAATPAALPATPDQPKQEEDKKMTVVGRVLGPGDTPLAGAAVAIVARPKGPYRGGDLSSDSPQVLGQTQADGEGRFRLEVPRTSSARYYEVYAVAGGKGCGLGLVPLNPDAEQPQAVLHLPPEQVIHGRLLDLQGHPAAGVRVYVAWLGKSVNGEPTGIQFWNPPRPFAPWPEPVATDSQGRFILRGLNPEQGVQIQARDDRFARRWLEIPPQKGDKEVNFVLAPSQLVEGRVVRADTGKPVPHARLTVYAGDNGGLVGMDGTADAEGYFHLNPYAGRLLTVAAYPPDGEPYLSVEKQFEWPKGAVKQRIELKLPRGVLVRGTITEAASHRPVAGAGVQFYPDEARDPNLRKEVLTRWLAMMVSGADGRFAIAVPPGPGHLLIRGPTPDFIHQEVGSNVLYTGRPGGSRRYPDALIKLDLTPGTAPRKVAITLRRGVTVRGQILGPAGQPVATALLLCRLYVDPFLFSWRSSLEVREGRFELPGCDPEQSYPVYFLDPRNRWGAAVMLSGRQAGEPVEVRLAPCGQAVVRFLDPQGNPVKAHRPVLEILVTPGPPRLDREALRKGITYADAAFVGNIDRANYWKGQVSDAQGRCTLPALIPGATYRLLLGKRGAAVVVKDFTVQAGKTTELGDVTVKPSP